MSTPKRPRKALAKSTSQPDKAALPVPETAVPVPAANPLEPHEKAALNAYREHLEVKIEPVKLKYNEASNSLSTIKPERGGVAMQATQNHRTTGIVDHLTADDFLGEMVWPTPKQYVNLTLAIASEIHPKDPIEGMLVAQMINCHHLAIKKLANANNKEMTLKQAEHQISASTRLMQVFLNQVHALDKLRNKGRHQKIVVQHQHIDNRGGQAVVQNGGQTPPHLPTGGTPEGGGIGA